MTHSAGTCIPTHDALTADTTSSSTPAPGSSPTLRALGALGFEAASSALSLQSEGIPSSLADGEVSEARGQNDWTCRLWGFDVASAALRPAHQRALAGLVREADQRLATSPALQGWHITQIPSEVEAALTALEPEARAMLREDPTSVVYARVHTSNMKFDDPAMEPAPGPTSASGWHLAEPVTLSRTYEPSEAYDRVERHIGYAATLTGNKYSVAFRLNQPDCTW